MTWIFPLKNWNGAIPTGEHSGAFGAKRKHDIHTGVDLYVTNPCSVYAVESGVVVSIENFTGPKAGSPWWLPTQAILIEGETGVVCYGEITSADLKIGDKIPQGKEVGQIAPVLPENKQRSDIPGHSRFMLHFELYKHHTKETTWWLLDTLFPESLLDPTKFLIEANKNQ